MTLRFDPALQIEQCLQFQAAAWQALITDTKLLADLKPTTLSIKVATKAALFEIFETNAAVINQLHIGTVNDRYIASGILFKAYKGLVILKVLERRAGSIDRLGLDSIDYLVPAIDKTFNSFKAAGYPIVKQHNDVHAWLSLRFGPDDCYEAKFTDHLVTEVAIKELQSGSQQLRQLS